MWQLSWKFSLAVFLLLVVVITILIRNIKQENAKALVTEPNFSYHKIQKKTKSCLLLPIEGDDSDPDKGDSNKKRDNSQSSPSDIYLHFTESRIIFRYLDSEFGNSKVVSVALEAVTIHHRTQSEIYSPPHVDIEYMKAPLDFTGGEYIYYHYDIFL